MSKTNGKQKHIPLLCVSLSSYKYNHQLSLLLFVMSIVMSVSLQDP